MTNTVVMPLKKVLLKKVPQKKVPKESRARLQQVVLISAAKN